MKVVSRSEWGARAPKWSEKIRTSKGTFIHYNGGTALQAPVVAGDFAAVCAHLRGVQAYHMDRQGWPDIAYSFCVDSAGRIYELRGFAVAGAHTLGWNWDSHAIYLPLGGNQAPTAAQIAAANQVIAEHDRRFGRGFVKGHQQAPNATSCPGGPTMARILAGDFHATQPPPTPPPTPPIPVPPGVDPTVNKPTMMREADGSIWIYYTGTPWRVHVKSVDDANAFKYMGVEFKDVDANTAAFFRRYSQEVKCK